MKRQRRAAFDNGSTAAMATPASRLYFCAIALLTRYQTWQASVDHSTDAHALSPREARTLLTLLRAVQDRYWHLTLQLEQGMVSILPESAPAWRMRYVSMYLLNVAGLVQRSGDEQFRGGWDIPPKPKPM